MNEQDLADLRSLMETIEGRRFVWRLLSRCGIFRQSYVQDSDGTAFNEGQRSIGLWVYQDLQMGCSDLFLIMQAEAADTARKQRIEDHERQQRHDDTE